MAPPIAKILPTGYLLTRDAPSGELMSTAYSGTQNGEALQAAFDKIDTQTLRKTLVLPAGKFYVDNRQSAARVGVNLVSDGQIGSFNNLNAFSTTQSTMTRLILAGDKDAPMLKWVAEQSDVGPFSFEGLEVVDSTALTNAHLVFMSAPAACGLQLKYSNLGSINTGKLNLRAAFMGFTDALMLGSNSSENNCDENDVWQSLFTICKNCVTIKTHQSVGNYVHRMRTGNWCECGLKVDGGQVHVRRWDTNGYMRPVTNWAETDSNNFVPAPLIKIAASSNNQQPSLVVDLVKIDNTTSEWRNFELLELPTTGDPIYVKINVSFDLATFDPETVIRNIDGHHVCINAMGRRGTGPSDPGCQDLAALSTWDGLPITS